MKRKSILIIDDEKEIGIMLESLIEDPSIAIEQIFNGSEALAQVKQRIPDLILLDLQLPEVNGMEILHAIRRENKRSRVVMITAFGTIENAVEAMKVGANDYLCKPFAPEDLQRILDQHLDSREQGEELTAPVSLEEMERKHIAAVLKLNNGNRRKTAEDLGISLRTLYYKIKQYDLV